MNMVILFQVLAIVETVYLVQNNENNTEFAKLYSVITQGFITILVLIGLGFFIGYKINKNSPWPIILAVVGGLIGIASMIIILLKLNLGGDKNGRDT